MLNVVFVIESVDGMVTGAVDVGVGGDDVTGEKSWYARGRWWCCGGGGGGGEDERNVGQVCLVCFCKEKEGMT